MNKSNKNKQFNSENRVVVTRGVGGGAKWVKRINWDG